MTVLCDYCGRPAKLVTGVDIYPHRSDLSGKRFYDCRECDAYVGCHPGTDAPLGRLANAELRAAKVRAHAAFDPIWRARLAEKAAVSSRKKQDVRNGHYQKLAELLGIPRSKCHIGMFDLAQCNRVVEICRAGLLSEP